MQTEKEPVQRPARIEYQLICIPSDLVQVVRLELEHLQPNTHRL